jgi:LuxR family quorum sensing-dependent transcriptional regulator
MGQLDRKHFQITLQALDQLEAANTEDELTSVIASSVSAFGFEHFWCATPETHRRSDFDAGVLIHRWPKDWFDLYRQSKFHLHDPIIKYTRSHLGSFNWSQVPVPDHAIARSIMRVAADDFQLRSGICVPIHGFNGYQASISFAGCEVEETAEAKSAVEMIAIYAVNKLTQFRAARPGQDKVLTPRQCEILSWTALGKTAWDIGQILSISEDTVNKLVAAAILRLDVSNRTHAVAEAIRRREISL